MTEKNTLSDDNPCADLGPLLASLRSLDGRTQTIVGRVVGGISRAEWSRMEKGKTRPEKIPSYVIERFIEEVRQNLIKTGRFMSDKKRKKEFEVLKNQIYDSHDCHMDHYFDIEVARVEKMKKYEAQRRADRRK